MNWRTKGKHRAGPEHGRLRQELKLAEGRIAFFRGRLQAVSTQNRTLKARAEIAEGRQQQAEAIVERQVAQLQQRDARIAELERLIETSGEDTVQTPIPQVDEPEPELAGAAA